MEVVFVLLAISLSKYQAIFSSLLSYGQPVRTTRLILASFFFFANSYAYHTALHTKLTPFMQLYIPTIQCY